MHSREGLDFIPRIARTLPVVRELVAAQEQLYVRRHGHLPDYAGAYWTPPLSEREAMQLETRQIEKLQLQPLVSLSDHDNIEAANHLHLFEEFAAATISVEWTVPYEESFFHLGIHNLPRESARGWMEQFARYTAAPAPQELAGLLEALQQQRETLVVFNHPLWDEKAVGMARHRQLLENFLARYGRWVHALELNGMRPWVENQEAIELAAASGHTIISGGDRHGVEPNAVLNLTSAASFAEFAAEMRDGAPSQVLILPAYREPYRMRYAEALWDVVRDYPERVGRERWTDRFYYRAANGEHLPFSEAWGGGDGPGIIGTFLSLIRILFSPRLRPTLRLAMRSRSEVLP